MDKTSQSLLHRKFQVSLGVQKTLSQTNKEGEKSRTCCRAEVHRREKSPEQPWVGWDRPLCLSARRTPAYLSKARHWTRLLCLPCHLSALVGPHFQVGPVHQHLPFLPFPLDFLWLQVTLRESNAILTRAHNSASLFVKTVLLQSGFVNQPQNPSPPFHRCCCTLIMGWNSQVAGGATFKESG